jgi:hypothetical protein
MQLKIWVSRIALGAIMVGGLIACQITDQLIAQTVPTPTRTRTPRPTFTPIPLPTQTTAPLPTIPLSTLAPSPTVKPTTRPLPTATKKPATAIPATQPPIVAGPTTSPYQWHVNPPGCEHAGGVFVKARVYSDKNDPNSGAPDMLVVLGDATGNRFDIPPVTTTYDGTYSFTLSADGLPPYKGSVYVWLIDSSGKRISDIGGPMVFDGKGPDVGCWHGWVDFWR